MIGKVRRATHWDGLHAGDSEGGMGNRGEPVVCRETRWGVGQKGERFEEVGGATEEGFGV